jgi:hypothetical protein
VVFFGVGRLLGTAWSWFRAVLVKCLIEGLVFTGVALVEAGAGNASARECKCVCVFAWVCACVRVYAGFRRLNDNGFASQPQVRVEGLACLVYKRSPTIVARFPARVAESTTSFVCFVYGAKLRVSFGPRWCRGLGLRGSRRHAQFFLLRTWG